MARRECWQSYGDSSGSQKEVLQHSGIKKLRGEETRGWSQHSIIYVLLSAKSQMRKGYHVTRRRQRAKIPCRSGRLTRAPTPRRHIPVGRNNGGTLMDLLLCSCQKVAKKTRLASYENSQSYAYHGLSFPSSRSIHDSINIATTSSQARPGPPSLCLH